MSPEKQERVLLARAHESAEYPSLSLLTAEKLREITAAEGVDFATALLYDRVVCAEPHASFIVAVDEIQKHEVDSKSVSKAVVAIVPAAFYKEKPHSGADGRVVRAAAARIGLRCELVPVVSTGSLADNSAVLFDWLRRHIDEKVILVSLCKGGADVKFALSQQAPLANVQAWVNICGTLTGSPVAKWLLATKLRSLATRLFLSSVGHRIEFLQQLVLSPLGPLSAPLRLWPAMKLISVAGFPLRRHVTHGFMRRCHKFISPQGPNDGGMLLADACHLPGLLYPVWGADHYLRPDERAQRILIGVLNYLLSEPEPQDMAHSPQGLRREN